MSKRIIGYLISPMWGDFRAYRDRKDMIKDYKEEIANRGVYENDIQVRLTPRGYKDIRLRYEIDKAALEQCGASEEDIGTFEEYKQECLT